MRCLLMFVVLTLTACSDKPVFTDAEIDAASEIASVVAEDAVADSDRISEIEARIDDLEGRLDEAGLE